MSKQPIWKPSQSGIDNLNITKFQHYINQKFAMNINDYQQLHRFSINETAKFWQSVVDFCEIDFIQPATSVVTYGEHMLDSRWFINGKLNYAQNILKYNNTKTAIEFENENGVYSSITYNQLYTKVAKLQYFLKQQGIVKGDIVAGFLPNIIETIIAMLATTSIGAVWTSTSPDFGFEGVVDRFGQVEAKILFTTDGYFYNGKTHDCIEKVRVVASQIASIKQVVVIPFANTNWHNCDFITWNEALNNDKEKVVFEPVDFSHPLYILYSSGTTGKPKCIVHGTGGILLQHKKELVLHSDVNIDDKLFYFTTCGWMMWNWMVSTLSTGATLVLYDGSPFYPDGNRLLDIVDKYKVTHFGTSAKWISAIEKADIIPNKGREFAQLRTILSTGSPLMPENYDYVYSQWKTDVCLSSISGGTDICSCFALGNPALPVYKGELQCLGLAMEVAILNDAGLAVFNEMGELSCLNAFPAMPVSFWNDEDNKKYKSAYFEKFTNIWCHGDLAKITTHNGLTIYGRSDATLNPGGVRIGTAEIYRQVDNMPEVTESIAIGQDWDNDVRVVLFVVLQDNLTLDDILITKIKTTIRTNTTPRHVPAKIIQVTAVPKTLSGKLVEIAVRNIIHNRPVTNTDALSNPEALEQYKNLSELTT
ncbi:Acetoacetyl-CoA synthetase [hydrothermal vent metagenome]|uniref:Acetoacetyl-CoA synthetase n=1 Tax=hydrothermal vent metagenome TaxID=652676 RepID=A0A3B0VXW4_9ZZZZ